MTIDEYIDICNACIKAGKLSRARKAFDLAWKEYAEGRYTDTDEKHLFWLRNTFYPRLKYYTITEKANQYETAILTNEGH